MGHGCIKAQRVGFENWGEDPNLDGTNMLEAVGEGLHSGKGRTVFCLRSFLKGAVNITESTCA